ncbi:MAG: redoxin family protein [Chloroflexi bacterium]|nr:redoxin family protein [Chloroflexota bacterium]
MSNVKHYILFDSGCAQCTDVAAAIEKESSGALLGMSLYAPEAKQLLDRARPGWKFEPTLLEVDGEHVRAFTGLQMRTHLVTFLNPLQLLKIARVVQQAGIPLLGAFEAHEPHPAETGTVETQAAQLAEALQSELPDGFAYTKDGPELGMVSPVAKLTTTKGKLIRLNDGADDNTILLFLSTTCGYCRKVAPYLAPFATEAPEKLVLVFSTVEADQLRAFVKEFKLGKIPLVISPETRSAFGVVGVPYGFALDAMGTIRGKGIVNNNWHLDSLANTFYVSVEALKQALASRKEDKVVVS